jgi:hypothetical protein
MVNIASAVRRVKDDLPGLLTPIVEQALREHPDHPWRDRVLNPLALIVLFVQQVMHGNTAITHLRHLSGLPVTAAAYCKARQRLPRSLVERVVQRVARQLQPLGDAACRWRGHRVWHADGTGVSMPDTPALRSRFGRPAGQKPGCGFPVATTLVLCDAAGFIIKTLACPLRTHEASQLTSLHASMRAGDVLVYDRAGCSYTHLALLKCRGLHGILRMHQRQNVSFRAGRKAAAQLPKAKRKGAPTSQWLERLGEKDQLVRWFKPEQRPGWMSEAAYDALPESRIFRELRHTVDRPGFRTKEVTLVTTLVDSQKYPKSELTEQYQQRWRIEVNFRHLKQTMGMDVLKCRSVDGVLKELAIFTLVYNLVRLVMLGAAAQQGVPPDRISFIDALRWLRDATSDLTAIRLTVHPHRPGRLEPRVRKRRPKPYPLMNQPRDELRQAMTTKTLAA